MITHAQNPNSYRRFFLFIVTSLSISSVSRAQVHILFDSRKGETAGNADWVIDADQTNLGVGASGAYITGSGHQSNAQITPTPAQSTVTASTAETYWAGALSSWGIDCVNKGYTVATLPWNGSISYNNTANAQDLSNYQVYIVDEPNIVFTTAEKTALINYVRNGGSLFVISDHNGSDRNGDGWDSPNIWNDFFTNNGVVSNPFGISFDLNDFSQVTTNISATATDSIIHGPMGNVAIAQWSDGTTMTLNTTANPTVKGVIYKTGSAHGNSNVMVAYGRYGSGKFAAMGDSSPTDDGTGNPNCTLYDGYHGDASGNHRLLLMNITIWLASRNATTGFENVNKAGLGVSLFPNPSTGTTQLAADHELTNATVVVYSLTGAEISHGQIARLAQGEIYPIILPHGFYFVKVQSEEGVQTLQAVVN